MRIDRVPHDNEVRGMPPHPVARPRLIEPLTARELEILVLVCDGWSNRDICAQLAIGLPTVKYHIANRILDGERQRKRGQYLVDTGQIASRHGQRFRFGNLHLNRMGA